MTDANGEAFNLQEKQVHVWLTFFRDIESEYLLDNYWSLLSSEEREKYERLHLERHRREYLISRAVARTVLSGYTGILPERLQFTRTEQGRPELYSDCNRDYGIRFNISHTTGLVMLAVARERDIGADVEYNARRTHFLDIARRFFAHREIQELQHLSTDSAKYRFFEYWTLKESFLKAKGTGMHIPLDRFGFSISDNNSGQIFFYSGGADEENKWQFWLFNPAGDYTAAISLPMEEGHANRELIIRKMIPLQSVQSCDCASITSGNP